jgi:hypothetical protein
MVSQPSVQTARPNYVGLNDWWDMMQLHYAECGECEPCQLFKRFIDARQIIDVRLKSK